MPDRPAYPRTTSLEFLTRCSETMRAFYRHWESKKRGAALPARADLDPLEMKQWLQGIVLIDIERKPSKSTATTKPGYPYRLTYRLVGTRATGIRGREATGRSVEDAYFGPDLGEVLENYRLVIEGRVPVYDWNHKLSDSGAARLSETLLLPLATDGRTVDMVVVYFEIEGA